MLHPETSRVALGNGLMDEDRCMNSSAGEYDGTTPWNRGYASQPYVGSLEMGSIVNAALEPKAGQVLNIGGTASRNSHDHNGR